MITITNPHESHALYQELQRMCPHYFASKNGVQYITDPFQIEGYELKTGERLGVLYKMDNHEIFVVDLVEKNGKMKIHGRIILPSNGVIIVPRVGDKFVLENQYRYPTCQTFLAFPRGHQEPGFAPEEDAIRETREELGAKLKNLKFLGKTYPETASNAWYCSVYLGDVEGLLTDESGTAWRDGYEGIDELILYSAAEIDELIREGEISCGYTLAAWALYKASLGG